MYICVKNPESHDRNDSTEKDENKHDEIERGYLYYNCGDRRVKNEGEDGEQSP